MEFVKLSKVVKDLESGSREKGGSVTSGIISIGGTHLSANGGFKWEKKEFVSEEFYAKMRSGKVQKNDILIVKDGATTGKVSFVDDNFPFSDAAINEHVFRLHINSDLANPKYIFYFLQSSAGKEQILNDFRGATVGGISREFVNYANIPLPSLDVQNKVVSILDKVRTVLDKREQTIIKYEELLRATFLDMFGMQNSQYEFWSDVEIGDLGKENKNSFRTGPFGSSLKHDRFLNQGEIAVLGIDNAVDNIFKWKKKRFLPIEDFEEFKRYTIFPRDVIITIMGTVGRSAVIPDAIGLAINTKHLAAISLDESKCNPYYLSYSIHSNPYIQYQLKAKSRGAVMAGFNLTLIKELKLKNAPIEAQNKFENIYLKCNNEIEKLTASKDTLRSLFDTLSNLAYKGELKLNASIDLELLLENEYDYFKKHITKKGLSLLLERLDKSNLNEKRFNDSGIYSRAVLFIFELLKEGTVKQVLDKGQIKLIVA